MEGYDYDAAARTINIIDITTNESNRYILRKLKENDAYFDKLWVTDSRDDEYDYFPESVHEMGWIGYFIGKNTTLKDLILHSNPFEDVDNNAIEPFYRGINSNRSIQKIRFYNTDLSGGEIFQNQRPFFENNNNLSDLVVVECEFGAGCARQLSLALRGCNSSLKHVKLSNNQMGDEPLAEIIEAVSLHSQLEKLELWRMNIGRKEYSALANLLLMTSELRALNLCNTGFDDEGMEALVGALANSSLISLDLSDNRAITSRGCQSVAALLENPNSNLERLYLANNNIGNEGALIFANAMASNRQLKSLDLYHNAITAEGWSVFSKVLCDTSSVNKTSLSNHALGSLGVDLNIPADVASLLALNRSSNDKTQVAIRKILKYHDHFDMQPFFVWDLKVLPLIVAWFERARSIVEDNDSDYDDSDGEDDEDNDDAGIGKQKLGAIYQFIRAMPEVFEPSPGARGEKRKWSAGT